MSEMDQDSQNSGTHIKATREDWLNAALDTLISDGVEQVKVLTLSTKLEVSRSSFYWYFKSREDLLDALLTVWRAQNTRAIVEKSQSPADTITQAVIDLGECWFDKTLFDPRLDFAIREWARRSGRVRRILDREDDARIGAMRDMFLRYGFEATDALVRARVMYFTQIGYYALELDESDQERVALMEPYLQAFTGLKPSAADRRRIKDLLRVRTD
ncbi:MAG: TetR/AcrR family transcriptional regulator [Pseudomonadota bacterium]